MIIIIITRMIESCIARVMIDGEDDDDHDDVINHSFINNNNIKYRRIRIDS